MILSSSKKTTNNVTIENLLHDSSNVLKTSYNFNTEQLYVTFKRGGDVYYYNKVDKSMYEGLKNAESIGVYLNKTIKPKCTYVNQGKASPEILSELLTEITYLKTDA